MPHYFFHVADGERMERDETGVDLPDLNAVMHEAVSAAKRLMREAAERGEDVSGRSFEVVDASGASVLTLPFVRAIDDTPG